MTFTIDPYRFTPPSEGKRLFMWGYNDDGGIGDGTIIQKDSPVQIGTAEWTHLSVGVSTTMARKTDGTLWMWGYGESGELGQGNYDSSLIPLQVGTDTDWSGSFSAGIAHSLAIKTDGTLWAWGYGAEGALGTGGIGDELSPVQVGVWTDWTAVSAGDFYSLGVRSTSTLWSWGTNYQGALGQGATDVLLSPTQVGVSTGWSNAIYAGESAAAGIRNTGHAYLWGSAVQYETFYWQTTVPTLLDADNDHVFVCAGSKNFHIVRTVGSLWAFGYNHVGQLGNGSTTHKEVPPERIGFDFDWTGTFSGKAESTLALRDDGTIWGWGSGTLGQIGDGAATDRLSPVQVGSATDWTYVTCGFYTSGGLRLA